MDIQVGDRVTYKLSDKIEIEFITNIDDIQDIKTTLKTIDNAEILKIERPKYEVVEEKKDLLTEEEKKFLKDMCKYYDVDIIEFGGSDIRISGENKGSLNIPDYPKNMEFRKIERHKLYTLKELGLD